MKEKINTIENKEQRDQIISKILENVPPVHPVEVDVPSKGRFYKFEDASKGVVIRAMNFEDEKILASAKASAAENTILSRCISNINTNELFLVDKWFLILKLRELSIGKEYIASVNCIDCQAEQELEFDLTQFPVEYFPEELVLPIELVLPVAKKTVKIHLPQIKHEKYLRKSKDLFINLWRFVESIEGYDSITIIKTVVEQLPLRDKQAIINLFNGAEYGIQTKAKFECDECGEVNLVEMPINQDFFSLS